MARNHGVPLWSAIFPLAACLVLALAWERSLGWALFAIVFVAFVAAVFAAVHHAEVVAHRVGEPFGTLVLAVAVTVIEVALIVSMMLSAGGTASALVRDTVFATVMIVCNGVLGLCLLAGAIRHHEVIFRVEGTAPALSVLAALTTLTLVLPTLTTTTPGPTFSTAQLAFAGAMSLVLYGIFVFVQMVRHRGYFLPIGVDNEAQHAGSPSPHATFIALPLLALALVAVVGLAKALAPEIRRAVDAVDAPEPVVGIVVALLVLLPETSAALRAATRNRMQTSFNLALGSALATIGLTIPTVAVVSIALGLPLTLGLPPKETALLALTLVVSVLTVGNGRATVLQGAVHLVLFAAFLFLALIP